MSEILGKNEGKVRAARTVSTKFLQTLVERLKTTPQGLLTSMAEYAGEHPNMSFQEAITAFANQHKKVGGGSGSRGGSNPETSRKKAIVEGLKEYFEPKAEIWGKVLSIRQSSKIPGMFNVSLQTPAGSKTRMWAKDDGNGQFSIGMQKITIETIQLTDVPELPNTEYGTENGANEANVENLVSETQPHEEVVSNTVQDQESGDEPLFGDAEMTAESFL